MKRLVLLVLCVTLLLVSVPVASAEQKTVYRTETVTQDGITIIDEISFNGNSRATEQPATRTRTYRDEDQNLMAIIAMQVVFRYDGSTVRVVSKSMTRTETYNGWNYEHNSYVTVGGKVTTKFYLSKTLYSQLFSFSITCDKDGNIT